MVGLYTIPQFNLDIRDFLEIQKEVDINKINHELNSDIGFFIIDYYKENFSKRNCLKKLKKIKKSNDELLDLLNSPDIHHYLVFHFSRILNEAKGMWGDNVDVSAFSLIKGSEECRLAINVAIEEIEKEISNHRTKDSPLSYNANEKQFAGQLMDIYKQATGKDPTAGNIEGIHKSKFVKFGEDIVNIINKECPNLKNGHNITIGFSDRVKKRKLWAKTQQKHIA